MPSGVSAVTSFERKADHHPALSIAPVDGNRQEVSRRVSATGRVRHSLSGDRDFSYNTDEHDRAFANMSAEAV